jgi:DNA helicase II / ATP-dependent DNA helicase PcrA
LRADVALGMTPSTIFLLDNYRSTNAIVDFCNDYVTLDSQFQRVRVANKPPIRASRGASHNVAVLGMFRDTAGELAHDLASFVGSVFTGGGYRLPSGELIEGDPDGNVGDCALLTFSPAERKNGRDRLPRLLRQELSALPAPISVFNPRGTDLADIPAVRQLCGLALECIDPAGNVQSDMGTLPRATTATLNAWRSDALSYASGLPPRTRASLEGYITSWQARVPRSVSSWPDRITLADLVYKLVTWIPPMQRDVEGLVHFEVALRTITEAARFSTYGASIVFRDDTWQQRSIRAAIRDIFSPVAEGAIDIDEDLLDTLPLDRLNVLSIHQSKGLEFPLVIVDVGSDFARNHAAQAFQRFPTDGALTHRLEDELRLFSRSLFRPNRSGQDRAFDDLIRSYFVAYSRAQDVLLLVGLMPVADGRVRSIAAGWDRTGTFRWGAGLPNLEMI